MNFFGFGKKAAKSGKTIQKSPRPPRLDTHSLSVFLSCVRCKSLKNSMACFNRYLKLKRWKIFDPLPSESVGQPVAHETGNPAAKKRVPFNKLPKFCFLSKRDTRMKGYLTYPVNQQDKLNLITIGYHGFQDPSSVDGVEIELDSICEMQISLSYSNVKIKMGENVWGKWVLRLFSEVKIEIGSNITCNKADVIVDDGELKIGDDCMFADIFIHVSDNHAIFDLQSGEALNVRRGKVQIGSHVWIASRATVLADCAIGAGSVVAANATVKGDIPSCVLVAGVPARVIKSGISWTRDPKGLGWQEVVQRLSAYGENGA